MEYIVQIEDLPSEEDVWTLIRKLVDYNDSKAETENWRRLVVFLRDGTGKIVGGLDGCTHWGWMYTSRLWVAEALRGRGYGREIMLRAEEEAVKRGCRHAYLDTFDFQSRSFYERLRYEVFATLEECPPGHSRFFLRKWNLAAD
jgi:GNAT superfamily N-acetyltransferase